MASSAPIHVYLAGDSTVATYPEERAPQAGWGQCIGSFFDDGVEFENHARGGRSSKTFITEGLLDTILAKIGPGDYLFVQMGHNDSSVNRPERYTEPDTTYREYLRQYIAGARVRGAKPLLLTPMARLHYKDGQFLDDFRAYCEAMRTVAGQDGVPLVDLMARSLAHYGAVGYDEVFTYYMASVLGTDFTHFTQRGATAIARLVAEGVRDLGLDLSTHVRV